MRAVSKTTLEPVSEPRHQILNKPQVGTHSQRPSENRTLHKGKFIMKLSGILFSDEMNFAVPWGMSLRSITDHSIRVCTKISNSRNVLWTFWWHGVYPLHMFLCISEWNKWWYLYGECLCKWERLVFFPHLPWSRAQQFSSSSTRKSTPTRYHWEMILLQAILEGRSKRQRIIL